MVFDYSKKLKHNVEIPFIHAIAMARRKIYIKYYSIFGSFEGSVQREDVDMQIKMGQNGERIVFCPYTTCYHLGGKDKDGGHWDKGPIRHSLEFIKWNNIFINQHYKYLLKHGLKGNKITFQILHILNSIRMVARYYLA